MQETHHRITNSPDDTGSIQEISLSHSSRETQVIPWKTFHSNLAWSNTGGEHLSVLPTVCPRALCSIFGCWKPDLGSVGAARQEVVRAGGDGCVLSALGAARHLSLEYICSTVLQPAGSSLSLFARLLLTEGRGRDLVWVQALVQLCLSSPRSLAVRRAGLPAVPSPAFTAALPVRTNGTAQKINSSHLYDNTAPPVRMLHHCF